MQEPNDDHLNNKEQNPNPPTKNEKNDHERFNGYYVPPLPGTGLDKCNVFIKFLPVEVTDTGLYAMFSKFGEITSYKVMVDPITGCSLGYGFCRYKTPEEAERAIKCMSGTVIGNKTLLCKLSHGISKNNSLPNNNLYIKPLLPTTTEKDLIDIFSKYGKIVDCKVMLDRNTGLSRQIGFVRFETIEDATKALTATNGLQLDENFPPIVVKYAENESHKISRKAKRFANQSAAAARKASQQFKMQKARMQMIPPMYNNDFNGPPLYPEQNPSEPMPYIVRDQFGNITFAPTSMSDMYIPDMGAYNMYPYDMGYDQMYPPYFNPNIYYNNKPYWPKRNKGYKKNHSRNNYNKNRNNYGYRNNRVNNKSSPWVEPNLFIFHLPPSIDDYKLRKMFEKFGPLEHVHVAVDKNTKQSKGYGFVKYYNMADAIKAIKNMNGLSIENKNLRVTFKNDEIKDKNHEYQEESSEESSSNENTGSDDDDDEEESEDDKEEIVKAMDDLTIDETTKK